MGRAYRSGFNLHNVIINRDKGTGATTGALRQLTLAMLNKAGQENMGIEKEPPHMLIYKNFLVKHKIHKKDGKKWRLTFSPQEVSPQIRKVAKKIEQSLFGGTFNSPCKFGELLEDLSAPPYGVKRLPALILCVVALLYHKSDLTLYERGEFAYSWDEKTLMRFLALPDEFAVAPASPEKVDDVILQKYYTTVGGVEKKSPRVLDIAKTLIINYNNLDAYGRNSEKISNAAQQMRKAIVNSMSPAEMLFNDLPAALGGIKFWESAAMQRKYFRDFKSTFGEIANATTSMQSDFSEILMAQYGANDLSNAIQNAREDASRIIKSRRMYSSSRGTFLQAFLVPLGDLNVVIKSVVEACAPGEKRMEYWGDDDAATTEFKFRQNLAWLRDASNLLRNSSNTYPSVFLPVGKDENNVPMVNGEKKIINNIIKEYPGTEERRSALERICSAAWWKTERGGE